MDPEALHHHCLQKPGVTEDFPFDEDTLTLKVMGKIFALLSLDATPLRLNLKCDPARALDLRDQYRDITPGYHMNKKHWNTLTLDGDIPPALLKELVDHSYDLVVKNLRKQDRLALQALKP